ncbi:hypothetical protein N7456_011589 [Penicillium angulare]|uniref:Uncharacterized protein n=1 Tax=Penicillium angulare TaxID=116970 RepID=A0A9W9JZZ4_9EURO|nr:hypothetical protein N7456_011589 [Penicillium angulare]
MKPAPFSEVLRRISRDMSLGNRTPSIEDPRAASSVAPQLPPAPYQQHSFTSPVTGKGYEQQPQPQEFLGSGFYNALGVQDDSNPNFANFWNFNTSPSDSQSDLSFLNVYPGVGSDGGDPHGLWQFFVGQDLL